METETKRRRGRPPKSSPPLVVQSAPPARPGAVQSLMNDLRAVCDRVELDTAALGDVVVLNVWPRRKGGIDRIFPKYRMFEERNAEGHTVIRSAPLYRRVAAPIPGSSAVIPVDIHVRGETW